MTDRIDGEIIETSNERISYDSEKIPSAGSNDENRNSEDSEKSVPPFCGFGIMCSTLNAIMITFSTLFVKLISSIEPILITAGRCYLQFLVIFPVICYQWRNSGLKVFGKPGMFKFLVLRGFTGSVSTIMLHQSITRLPIGDAVTISFTNSVYAMFLGCVCLGEAITLIDVALTVLTMAGVVCIAKPPFLMGSDDASYDSNTLYGVVFGIASAILHASTFIIIRKLGKTSALLNIFYFSLVGVVITSIMTLATGVFRLPCTTDLPYLVLHTVFGTLGQVAMIAALKYERATTFAILKTSQIVFVFVMQVVILNDVPSLMSIIGASLVFIAMLTMSIRKIYNQRRREREDIKDE